MATTGPRRNFTTWGARALFLLLAFAFIGWGIGGVGGGSGGGGTSGLLDTLLGGGNWVARVGTVRVTPEQFDQQYRRGLAQAARQTGSPNPTPEIQQAVQQQTLQRAVVQAALAQEAKRLGVVVPDDVLRQAIYDLPAFRGPSGAFDRATYDDVLRRNDLTESTLLPLIRADIAQRQILEPVRAGASVPARLVQEVYRAGRERRTADLVNLPFAAVPPPPDPDEATLRRWYDNHPDVYATPELRHLKAAELTAESVGKEMTVTDAEIAAAYDLHKGAFDSPELRTARIATVGSEDQARALVAAWRGGASWEAVQAMAQKDGGSAIELPQGGRTDFPSAALADAVFGATPGLAADPVAADGKWDALLVTDVTPAKHETLAQARDTLRAGIVAERAGAELSDRAAKVEEAFGTGAGLDDQLPTVGLVAVTGTIDATGHTAGGAAAPIPGPPELRQAIIDAAFAAAPNAPPHLASVPTPSAGGGEAYYAVTVDAITPPAPIAFGDARARVLEDWRHAEVRRAQETKAAALLGAAQDGAPFDEAARKAGLVVTRTAPVTIEDKSETLPPALVGALFDLKPGVPTMVETPSGFLVASVATIETADPAADPTGVGVVREQLAKGAADDFEIALVNALRDRAHPEVNQQLLRQVVAR